MINPERYKQIDELFQAALDIEPAGRSAFLDSACGEDQPLREEVEALIASSGQGWSLVDEPVPEIAALFSPEHRPELTLGESLGHYSIISLLGAGGMGQVYLAEDLRLGRRVALKLLSTSFTRDQSRLRRFQQEARAASALNHPNILTIFDIWEVEGRNLIATEYIHGETLRKQIERARFRVSQAIEISIQVASALSAAHQTGIIHRDVKPENIMLRHDGLVKVLDFGLAKLIEGYASVADPTESIDADEEIDQQQDTARGEREGIDRLKTEAGLLMGTLPYMSPEQLRGDDVDARTDLFSLGVVMYEMLTGRQPFTGETNRDLINSVLNDDTQRLC